MNDQHHLPVYSLLPAATNGVVLHPHQTKRKPTAAPSLLFTQELAQPSSNIPPIDLNNRFEKVAIGIDPAFNFVCRLLRPILPFG
jgi:hypothetical protein